MNSILMERARKNVSIHSVTIPIFKFCIDFQGLLKCNQLLSNTNAVPTNCPALKSTPSKTNCNNAENTKPNTKANPLTTDPR